MEKVDWYDVTHNWKYAKAQRFIWDRALDVLKQGGPYSTSEVAQEIILGYRAKDPIVEATVGQRVGAVLSRLAPYCHDNAWRLPERTVRGRKVRYWVWGTLAMKAKYEASGTPFVPEIWQSPETPVEDEIMSQFDKEQSK